MATATKKHKPTYEELRTWDARLWLGRNPAVRRALNRERVRAKMSVAEFADAVKERCAAEKIPGLATEQAVLACDWQVIGAFAWDEDEQS